MWWGVVGRVERVGEVVHEYLHLRLPTGCEQHRVDGGLAVLTCFSTPHNHFRWPLCPTPMYRFFLFGSRDMWFEVPLPFFLRDAMYGLGWSRPLTGLFLALWIIVYGQVGGGGLYTRRKP